MPFTEQVTAGTPVVTNVQTTTQQSMSPTMKTYYNTELLENARELLYLLQFAEKAKIKGNKVEFRRFIEFDYMPDDVLLQEGVIPEGKSFGMETVEAVCRQYGAYTAISDRLEKESIDPVILGCTEEHGARAAEVIEMIVRNILCGGTFAACAPKVSGGVETGVDSPTDLDKTAKITGKIIAKMATWMKKNKVPKIKGYWNWYIHPDCVFDLRNDTDWKAAHENGDQEEIYNGEIGRLHGFRFIESNLCRVHAPAEISDGLSALSVSTAATASTTVYVSEELTPAASVEIPVYIGGTANKITKIEAGTDTHASETKLTLQTAATATTSDSIYGQGGTKGGLAYYDNFCFGKSAYGTADPEGENLEMIIKDKGEVGGPLEQFSTVGWKVVMGALILYAQRLLRLEVCSSLADETESN